VVPRVSIAMPACNGARYIPRSINSALKQTHLYARNSPSIDYEKTMRVGHISQLKGHYWNEKLFDDSHVLSAIVLNSTKYRVSF